MESSHYNVWLPEICRLGTLNNHTLCSCTDSMRILKALIYINIDSDLLGILENDLAWPELLLHLVDRPGSYFLREVGRTQLGQGWLRGWVRLREEHLYSKIFMPSLRQA